MNTKKKIKIYCYDIPEDILYLDKKKEIHLQWKPTARHDWKSMYSLPLVFYRFLKISDFSSCVTNNIEEANFFFIPQFTTYMYHHKFKLNSQKSSNYLLTILNYLEKTYSLYYFPCLKKHILCLPLGNKFLKVNQIKDMVKLQHHASVSESVIQLPYPIFTRYFSLDNHYKKLYAHTNDDEYIMFAGTVIPNKKYSLNVRQTLLKNYKNGKYSKDVLITKSVKHIEYYFKSKYKVKFMLCPEGWNSNTPRPAEAIFHECIPVILSDVYKIPFQNVFDFNPGTIYISPTEENILNLEEILRHYNTTPMLKFWKKNKYKQLYNYDAPFFEQEVGILFLKELYHY